MTGFSGGVERRSSHRIKDSVKLEEIVSVALRLQAELPDRNVKMSEVIEASNIKRSSFLKLVPNYGSLVIQLYIVAMNKLFNLIAKSNLYKGSGRERFYRLYVAILLFVRLEPQLSLYLYESLNSRLFAEVKPELMEVAKSKYDYVVDLIYLEVELAVANDEIKLPDRVSPRYLALYMQTGHVALIQHCIVHDLDVFDELTKYKYYIRKILDNLPWHPTSYEIDFDDVLALMVESYYMDEFKAVGGYAGVGMVNIK